MDENPELEWTKPSVERLQALEQVYGRLADRGIQLNGTENDRDVLLGAIRDGAAVWAFTEPASDGFYAWIDEWEALQADAYGWTLTVALARAVDRFLGLQDDRRT